MPSPDLRVKWCRSCAVEHPVESFYSDRRAPDGLDQSCKDARLAQRRQRRQDRPDEVRAADRRHGRAYRQRKPGQPRRAHPPEDPEKHRARGALNRAVREGRIVRPDKCDSCRTVAAVQAHHPRGYSRDHQLDVEWLCSTCHGERHRAVA